MYSLKYKCHTVKNKIMSLSPERRFATSPKHEMLKMALKNPSLSINTLHGNTKMLTTKKNIVNKKMSLLEYKKRENEIKNEQRVMEIEEHLNELHAESNKTRERVESISKKLDFLIQKLCKETMFVMDDI